MSTLMLFSPPVNLLAILCLLAGMLCALVISFHLAFGHAQHMWIMNFVWPLTALYLGPVAVWAYFKWGRSNSDAHMKEMAKSGMNESMKEKPFWQVCSTATTHCGSGCALGDLIGEWVLFCFPFAVLGHVIFASWIVDFIIAFLLGIGFQYFTIQPMRKLRAAEGLREALKADALSITAWQIGMYLCMAVIIFGMVGHEIPKQSPVFWLAMQVAMIAGFIVSYPVNAWLLKRGVKEAM